ncbi:DUF4056 domain-containing protein [Candidatus Arsenophonus triatominarum]|uniref:DUF4056 domain-containing protein n=1 Tax=Candidatus Arsenophonus triatominarum TaxID=57911 RepID=UPI000941341F
MLYSNLLGPRIALTLILQGQASSVTQFSVAMAKILPLALKELGAYAKNETKQMFDQIDNLWWNSKMHVPEKFLVLKRDYETRVHVYQSCRQKISNTDTNCHFLRIINTISYPNLRNYYSCGQQNILLPY